MPVEFHAATPFEVYTITAADYGITVAVGILIALLAAGLGMWVFWPEREPTSTPAPTEVDSIGAAKTVEIPRRSGPRTAPTIHAPQYGQHVRPDDVTVVMQRAETRR